MQLYKKYKTVDSAMQAIDKEGYSAKKTGLNHMVVSFTDSVDNQKYMAVTIPDFEHLNVSAFIQAGLDWYLGLFEILSESPTEIGVQTPYGNAYFKKNDIQYWYPAYSDAYGDNGTDLEVPVVQGIVAILAPKKIFKSKKNLASLF